VGASFNLPVDKIYYLKCGFLQRQRRYNGMKKELNVVSLSEISQVSMLDTKLSFQED